MTESYAVRLRKERFVFSSAHFITYGDDVCEPLHGHNYHVEVEIEGPLEENCYVIDFVQVTEAVQALLNPLDHHMLLPTQHPQIAVAESEDEVEVRHGDRRWVFPRQDCVLLPIENTTAELLARYIGTPLQEWLNTKGGAKPSRLRVSVDECDGQWGVCEFRSS